MKKESVSYEIMIDLITNIVKKYINNDGEKSKEANDKCLNVG
ncbi:hypothetical protein [Clostridium sp.]|nr:hypothetical protein [Clostridium sp.]